jgi:hypothetical protein
VFLPSINIANQNEPLTIDVKLNIKLIVFLDLLMSNKYTKMNLLNTEKKVAMNSIILVDA